MRDRCHVVMFVFVLTGLAIPNPVSANLAGTDLNLSTHPVTGGMAGAGYTIALEPSAALFGNPASLTQMKGIRYNLGATYFHFFGNNTKQEFGDFSNTSTSANADYIIPVTAATFELIEDLVLGVGVEVDAGAGVDYRDDPITLLGTPDGAFGTTVPALAQIISFNANVGLAYEIADKISIGGALTLGFGLLQLGTAGTTTGILNASTALETPVDDFGGTTSTVQDIGVGGSVGLNVEPLNGFRFSVAYKSAVKYEFDNLLSTTVGVPAGGQSIFQDLNIQQPQEVVFGVGFQPEGIDLTLAFDAVWKNWENADGYKDFYNDQWLLMLGGQYVVAEILALRLGYSYATPILKTSTGNTVGDLTGIGTIPFGDVGGALSPTVVTLVQMNLLPVIWLHNVTAGVGIDVTDKVQIDVFASVSIPNSVSREAVALSAALQSPVIYEADFETALWVGAGVQVAIGTGAEEQAETTAPEVEEIGE